VNPTEAEFDEFYRAYHSRLVAMALALVGDLAEAQDLAQEAFCRMWRQWDAVARHDQPAAWTRRVVANLATSRWRHLRTAREYMRRQRRTDVPELSPDHVVLVAALRRLPTNQRCALVLHYIADVPVTEVARDLGVPVGTVKAWLHRGRRTLGVLLADTFEEAAEHE
jgi:RNA polymerase sigma-70 factor (ECF subfamily)